MASNPVSKEVDLDPGLAAAYANRGLVYTAKDEVAKATSDLEKYIELSQDPSSAQAAKHIIDELRSRQ